VRALHDLVLVHDAVVPFLRRQHPARASRAVCIIRCAAARSQAAAAHQGRAQGREAASALQDRPDLRMAFTGPVVAMRGLHLSTSPRLRTLAAHSAAHSA
jgi:hypothetical protein